MTPRAVHNSDAFAAAVQALRDSLDAALAQPEPDYSRWEELRGDWWRNWDLASWVNAAHAYRHASSLPVDAQLLGTWQTLLPERGGGGDTLREHLTYLIQWAQAGESDLSADAWDRAFEVLRVGAFYE